MKKYLKMKFEYEGLGLIIVSGPIKEMPLNFRYFFALRIASSKCLNLPGL